MAIAPFLLVILSVASLIGGDTQTRVISLASDFSPEVGEMINLIIDNVNKGVNLSSLSGLIGLGILLFTASLVFIQIRYAFDVIYGYHEKRGQVTFLRYVYNRLFAMMVVFLAGIFLILSSLLPGIVRLFGNNETVLLYSAFAVNFLIFVAMFWGIHFFTPSERPPKRDALKMAVLSSIFFITGNTLLGIYFREVATGSIYGAAGALLIFLIWTYYSSFTLFLTVELFLFVKRTRKIM